MKALTCCVLGLGSLLILNGCGSTTASAVSSPAGAGCPGGNIGPSVRYGSLNLTPTVGFVNTTPVVDKTLIVSKTGTPAFQLDFGGPMIGDDFEICVLTNPPARKTHLGVDVTGVLEDPGPLTAGGSVNFWQNVFATFFVRPLQDDQTDANGVLKVDVPAQNLRNAIAFPPSGIQTTGRMLITIILSDGPHKLDLTLASQ